MSDIPSSHRRQVPPPDASVSHWTREASDDLPSVSVVLPTITIDSWLDAAVASVLGQSGVNVQLVVVFDGVRADRQRTWANDPRVVLAELPERGGLANALNEGIARADHEYVARLDADDISLPSRLSRQHAYLSASPEVVMVGSGAERIDEDGHQMGALPVNPTGDARSQLLWRNCLVHSSVMFRRSAVLRSGGYKKQLRQMEDYDLWLRLALLGKVAITEEAAVQYRVHPGQMSRGAAPRGIHVSAVMAGRRRLAQELRVQAPVQRARDLVWLAVNYARFYGLRKPRYA